MTDEAETRWTRLMVRVELLDQAVRCLALGTESLEERLALSRGPLSRIARHDLESEAELALYARVRLGLSQLPARKDDRGPEPVPVFALEATASHIVDLYEVSANRMVRAARGRPRRRGT